MGKQKTLRGLNLPWDSNDLQDSGGKSVSKLAGALKKPRKCPQETQKVGDVKQQHLYHWEAVTLQKCHRLGSWITHCPGSWQSIRNRSREAQGCICIECVADQKRQEVIFKAWVWQDVCYRIGFQCSSTVWDFAENYSVEVQVNLDIFLLLYFKKLYLEGAVSCDVFESVSIRCILIIACQK